MVVVPRRFVPLRLDGKRVITSPTAMEGKCGQIGSALLRQGRSMGRAGVVRFPPHIRSRWDTKPCNDTFEVEAVGSLLCRDTSQTLGHWFVDPLRRQRRGFVVYGPRWKLRE